MNKRWLFLYDFLLVRGGAESMACELCKAFKDIDLVVGFIDRNSFPEDPISCDRITQLTSPTSLPGWQTIKTAWAFQRSKLQVCEYEKVIFSGSNSPLAVNYRNHGGNVLFCHTPPRFIYDLKDHYMGSIPWWQKLLLKTLIAYIKPKYEASVARMDLVIANSNNVKKRIAKYLGKEAIVVYPPCDTNSYCWGGQSDFYLSTARVEDYKRIEYIVDAFKMMPDKILVVASGGSQFERLRAVAEGYSNIHFTGWLDEKSLRRLVATCIATIYIPIDEDFGISPVESMAAGKPVIGVADGGIVETVLDGVTGLLCPKKITVADIVAAVNKMTPDVAMSMRVNCEHRAELFSTSLFLDKMRLLLECENERLQEIAKLIDASVT